MRWTHRSLPTLALAALLAAGTTLAPNAASAQGNSHKHKADKELAKQARREARDGRYGDRRGDDRWDDRDRDRRRADGRYATVPRGHLPPAGMCRIWIDGVPPGRQPRPTDCRTAERNRPYNARVIYGPRTDRRYDARYDERYDPRTGRVYDDRVYRGGRTAREDVLRGERTRRDDVLRGGRDGRADTCVDANRDGRCDY
jgi:hypothetical protein